MEQIIAHLKTQQLEEEEENEQSLKPPATTNENETPLTPQDDDADNSTPQALADALMSLEETDPSTSTTETTKDNDILDEIINSNIPQETSPLPITNPENEFDCDDDLKLSDDDEDEETQTTK